MHRRCAAWQSARFPQRCCPTTGPGTRCTGSVAQRSKFGDAGLELGRFAVAVECDHVGVVELDASDCTAAAGISPASSPDAARQRLDRIRRTRPLEHLGKQRCDKFLLVFPLHVAVHARGIVGFIPQVPTQNAIIVAELAQHARDVVVQNAAGMRGSSMCSAPGLCTQPELCTPGVGGGCGPTRGNGFQQESNRTNSGLMPWLGRDRDELCETAEEPPVGPGPTADREGKPARC